MKSRIFIIICLTAYLDITFSVNITCSYNHYSYPILGSAYHCNTQNKLDITSPQLAQIYYAANTHQSVMNNDDVIGFFTNGNNVQYFPLGLSKIYPNLKAITVRNGRLKEVHQSDLREYTNIVFLNLGNNNLEIIEDELFEYNLNLEWVSLSSNKIFHVDPKAFSCLEKLTTFQIQHNKCINEVVEKRRSGVEQIFNQMKNRCVDKEPGIIDGKIQKLELDSKTLDYEAFMVKFESFEKGFKNSKFYNFSPQRKHFEKLKNSINENEFAEIAQLELTTERLLSPTTFSGNIYNSRNFEQQKQAESVCKIDEYMMATLLNLTNTVNEIRTHAHQEISQNCSIQFYDEKFSALSRKIDKLDKKVSNIGKASQTVVETKGDTDDVDDGTDQPTSADEKFAKFEEKFESLEENLRELGFKTARKLDKIEKEFEVTRKALASLESKLTKTENRLTQKIEEILEEKLELILSAIKTGK